MQMFSETSPVNTAQRRRRSRQLLRLVTRDLSPCWKAIAVKDRRAKAKRNAASTFRELE